MQTDRQLKVIRVLQVRVPTVLVTKKIQEFSKTFQYPQNPHEKIFQDLFRARECLYIQRKKLAAKVAKFINIPHCINVSNSQTQTGCYTIAACFPLEQLENT